MFIVYVLHATGGGEVLNYTTKCHRGPNMGQKSVTYYLNGPVHERTCTIPNFQTVN
jgi:hypothetical protein